MPPGVADAEVGGVESIRLDLEAKVPEAVPELESALLALDGAALRPAEGLANRLIFELLSRVADLLPLLADQVMVRARRVAHTARHRGVWQRAVHLKLHRQNVHIQLNGVDGAHRRRSHRLGVQVRCAVVGALRHIEHAHLSRAVRQTRELERFGAGRVAPALGGKETPKTKHSPLSLDLSHHPLDLINLPLLANDATRALLLVCEAHCRDGEQHVLPEEGEGLAEALERGVGRRLVTLRRRHRTPPVLGRCAQPTRGLVGREVVAHAGGDDGGVTAFVHELDEHRARTNAAPVGEDRQPHLVVPAVALCLAVGPDAVGANLGGLEDVAPRLPGVGAVLEGVEGEEARRVFAVTEGTEG
mmetsp:Transcript_47714/g.97528  ORF Transcript_47714/g.97528 Transcript_47714/m.97528 type:complete len:359 (-) Transcript_47714:1040-2116(-)